MKIEGQEFYISLYSILGLIDNPSLQLCDVCVSLWCVCVHAHVCMYVHVFVFVSGRVGRCDTHQEEKLLLAESPLQPISELNMLLHLILTVFLMRQMLLSLYNRGRSQSQGLDIVMSFFCVLSAGSRPLRPVGEN